MRRELPLRALGWLAVAALLWPRGTPPVTRSATQSAARWLGPAASFAASATWIRFDLALRNGHRERAYLLAEEALALAPEAPEGWSTLARHLIFDRGSFESAASAGERRRWIEAGLEVFERGELASSNAGLLAHQRGTILAVYVSEIAADVAWPGGARGALEAGIRALERARELGHEPAGELLAGARAALADLDGR